MMAMATLWKSKHFMLHAAISATLRLAHDVPECSSHLVRWVVAWVMWNVMCFCCVPLSSCLPNETKRIIHNKLNVII